jgi:hypothetical protein
MPAAWKQWEVRLEEMALGVQQKWSGFAAGVSGKVPLPQELKEAQELGEQARELTARCMRTIGKQHWATALTTRCLADAMVFLRRDPVHAPAPEQVTKLRALVHRWLKFLDRCIAPHVPLQTFAEKWEKVLISLT